MLEATYRLKLGQDEFELKATVKDEKEFFETMSFYSSLPKSAPGGSSDLRLAFRTTTDGYKYYSLVSETEKMEFRFGQNLEKNGGGLFPKGWEPLFQGEGQQAQAQAPRAAAAPKPSPLPPSPTGTPRVTAMPPKPAAMPSMPTLAQPQAAVPTPAVATAPPVATQPAPQPAAVQNPQVTTVANNVLARFGINK